MTHRHLGPFLDHFGADTGRSSRNSGFRKQIGAVSAPNRFRNRSGCQFRLGTRIDRFPKLPHNQHPAGSHSKSRAGLFASSKNRRGAINSTMSFSHSVATISFRIRTAVDGMLANVARQTPRLSSIRKSVDSRPLACAGCRSGLRHRYQAF